METETYQLLEQGFAAAFTNRNISSNLAYKPQFVSNDYRQGKKVLSSIEDELFSCDEFAISVAFITRGGITPLLQTLKELEKRGIPGRILTTDYLNACWLKEYYAENVCNGGSTGRISYQRIHF